MATDTARLTVLQRIDWKGVGGKKLSALRKVWADGREEFKEWDSSIPPTKEQLEGPLGQMFSHPDYKAEFGGDWAPIDKKRWDSLCKVRPPISTYRNSEWGDGLPDAKDLPREEWEAQGY